jgi:hypothetical protein
VPGSRAFGLRQRDANASNGTPLITARIFSGSPPQELLTRALTPAHRLRYDGEEMAKRPDFTPEQPLSADQLGEMRRRFSMLSRTGLQQAYGEVWERCKLGREGRPPKAEFIQELVQAWRELRKSA